MSAPGPASEGALPPTQPACDGCADCAQLRSELAALKQELSRQRGLREQTRLLADLEGRRAAAAQQRADAAHTKRNEYKKRLREAAEGYAKLKESYMRMLSALREDGGEQGPTPVPVAAAEPAAAKPKAAPVELEATENTHNSDPAPAAAAVKAEPEERREASAAVQSGARAEAAPPAAPPAATAAPAHQAPQVRKPAWKKAVRDGDDDGFGGGSRRRRGSKRQAEEEDAAVEAAFNAPPPKRHLPPGGVAAPAAPAPPRQAPAPAPPPAPAPRPGQFDPAVNGGMPYKHRDVVRKKEERAALPAFECQDCRRFYEAVERWGGVVVGGMPACSHRPEDAAAAAAALREQLLAGASRHRYRYEPPPTPEGFWDLGLTPTK